MECLIDWIDLESICAASTISLANEVRKKERNIGRINIEQ